MEEEQQKIKEAGLKHNKETREKIKSDERYAEELIKDLCKEDK